MRFNVDFWHFVNNEGDFVDAAVDLRAIHALAAARRLRRDPRGEHADYVEIIDIARNQYFGFVARVRMTGIPGRFNLRTGQHHELAIGDDEGVDELAFLLYDEPTQIIATQRNRLVRSSTIEDLLTHVSGTVLGLNPVLRQDKWARFEEMETVGSFTFRVKGPLHHPDFSNVIPSLGRLMEDSQREVNAQTFELALKAPRGRRNSLNRRLMQRIMRRIRATDNNVDGLRITGRVGESPRSEAIDFIRDRLVFSAEAEYDGRTLRPEQCQHILRRAIEENRRYLARLL